MTAPGAPTPGLLLLGSAGGIGAAIARHWRADDPQAPIWITHRSDRAAADRLRAEVGGTVVECDVTSDEQLRELAATIASTGGRLRSVVHAAVAPLPGRLLDIGGRLVDAIDVSAVSLVRASGALREVVVDGASIVYLTSIGSSRVVDGYGSVGVAKAAGEAIVRYLAAELGHRGIRVNAVGSGPVATAALAAMFGDGEKIVAGTAKRSILQPASTADDVGALVTALCGPAGGGVTGQVIGVDGGVFLR